MRILRSLLLAAALAISLAGSAFAQLSDVTQPGDPIVPSSNNSPGSEGVANAIDNQPTKYLNFDRLNTGFTVTPRVGLSIVQGLTLVSANDAPERDPADYTLEGSYDNTNFTAISSGTVPPFPTRGHTNIILFDNSTPYLSYRLIFPNVVGPGGNSMQIREVELLGFLAPTDVTQPGDPIVGTSNNTPGSEGVANAIDNQPTKYLNFDRLNTGFTVTPSVGPTLVSGITLTSANDAPERDPADYTLEGSLNGSTFFPIASGTVPPFPTRGHTNYIFFSNSRVFRAYRLIFPNVVGPGGNSMQIREVQLLGVTADIAQDVTQPGDPIVGTSNNTPGSEGVANAIDNQPTKYLNFDRLNTGFTVSPRSGLSIVSGLTLVSANDAPERDPADYTLEGSYDNTNFTAISSGTVPAFPTRGHTNTILFANKIPYLQYRLIFPNVVGPGGNSMQIREVELLGVLAPTDVTVPGDPIVASSNNSPGSEGVANAIDNQPTKYLNFDRLNTGFTVTPRVGDTILIGLTLTSANDAPERDPSSYTLEGAIDGVNYFPISSGSVPVFPTRGYTNYIFFADNTRAYKSYRLIFPTVAGPGGNSMQIREVEFLGVTPGVVNTNPVSNLIARQPQDTPVLLGSTATFRVGLTGPWRVQWYRNGVAIPGANSAAYTTAPASAGDDGALFKAVVQGRDGRQTSDEVMLSIFTPSTTESIGLNFRGAGASGAPTDMLPDDITGFHAQARWNNLTGGSGTLANPINSSNAANPTITVNWATSGEWGVGTGITEPTERLLNGMVTSFSTTEAGAQTVTLGGVPPGNHSVFLYTVQVGQEFFNMNFAVVTHDSGGNDVIQRRYIRPLNADEYNPLPGFSLVTSDTPESRGVGNMLRFDNLQPGPDGVIQVRFFSPGRVDLPGGDPIRGPGLNGMQLVLNPPPAGQPPVITRQPASANGILGGQVTLFVEATGPGLSYQWLKNGQEIAGETASELVLSGLDASDAGNYAVVISNPAGRVRSSIAVVGVLSSGQLTAGVITYFKLDETTGFVAQNSAPGGQPGEVRAFFEDWDVGQVGNCLAFVDGLTHIYVPNYPKVSQAMTVAGWVQSRTDTWGPIINNWIEGRTTGQSGQFLVDVILENGIPTLRAQIEVGPNRVLASAPIDASLNVWHHFAMSANGVTLSLYWDGQLVSTVDYLGTINATPAIPWLAIGAALTREPTDTNPPQPDPAQPVFVGLIDDIAIWNRSLSDIELVGIYNGGLSGQNISQVPPVLNINRSPVGVDDTATTPQGTAVTINVLANDTDADNDTLSVSSVTVAPANGTATVNGGGATVTYTPNAGFIGTDSFTYRISDGHGGIGSAVVRVTVLDTTPPQVTCPGNITAPPTGPDGAVVNYVATATDPGGLRDFNCAPASGSTFPIGETTVVCTATDVANNSASCSFKVTVGTPNLPPIADASATATNVISANGSNAVVHLDGTRSSDPDGDALTYSWLADGNPVPIASGALATAVLDVGTHQVVLVVDDGIAVASDTVEVNVITAAEAVEDLVSKVNDADIDRKTKRPFIASLKASAASFERGSNESGINQLAAFQNKVRAQIARNDPALAEELIAAAQAIIDALQAP